MRVIGVMAHTERYKALELALDIHKLIFKLGAVAVFEKHTAEALGQRVLDDGEKIECLIVIGGDGCVLRGARFAAERKIPVLGVNLGRLGFLSEVEPGEMEYCIKRLLEDDFTIENRMMLQGKLARNPAEPWLALNDFIIFKENVARLTEIEVSVNSQVMDRFQCDGIVIATPTGSTAYSLSARGPLIHPSTNCIIITPVCPHKISVRPMVVSDDSVVSIKIFGGADTGRCSISSDGKKDYSGLSSVDELIIEKSDYYTELIHIKEYRFFDLLKEKLY